MKTLCLTAMIIALSFGAFAQETIPVKDTIPTEQPTQKKDGYLFKDGKMRTVKDGRQTEMTEDVTLANGTVVTTGGSVKKPNGEAVSLKENQMVDLQGNITDWKE